MEIIECMTYAEAIAKLRKKMLLTQTELANLLGVYFGTANRWESGKYEPIMKMKRKLVPYFEKYDVEVNE